MKRIIWFALAALMFLALFTGCNTGRTVVGTDGVHRGARDGYHYRHDGYVTDGRHHHRTDGHRHHRTDGHRYRHDGRVTDTDGIIGNGTNTRPNGRVNHGRAIDGIAGADGARNAGSTRWARDGVVTPWSAGRGTTTPGTTIR